eukprot:1336896-Amorphochlora_amoeboformis.AAC.1
MFVHVRIEASYFSSSPSRYSNPRDIHCPGSTGGSARNPWSPHGDPGDGTGDAYGGCTLEDGCSQSR